MIIVCCSESFFDFDINWGEVGEVGTAIGTALLAVATVYLWKEAKKQLTRAKEFIEKYTSAVDDTALFNRIQSAENIVMKQIELHYKILENIKKNDTSSRGIFQNIYNALGRIYSLDTEYYNNDAEGRMQKIGVAYSELYRKYGHLLGHYYRNLYRIFRKIEETDIKGFDKNMYIKLVRAQLSEFEILLLFCNCIWMSENNDPKFMSLVEDYGLLKGMNYDLLMKLFRVENEKEKWKPYLDLYNDSAYDIDVS